MSYPYPWANGEYPLNVGSGESTGGSCNDFPEAGQEEERGLQRYEDPEHMAPDNANVVSIANQGSFPMYGGEQRDVQGYLDGYLHQQPSPAVGEGDWQMEPSHSSHQPSANCYSQLELDPRNPASRHDPQPQEVVPSGRNAQLGCGPQSPDSNSNFELVPTFGSDPRIATQDAMTTYGDRSSNLGVELGYDWLTESDMVIDHEPSAWTHAVPAAEEQFEHEEGAPWSTENQHNEHPGLTVAQLNWLANMAGASDTSCESQNSGQASNQISSTSGSAGDSEDPDWGENSVLTVRPTELSPGNPSDHTRYASYRINDHAQVQDLVALPTSHAVGYQDAHQYSIPDRTAVQGTTRRE